MALTSRIGIGLLGMGVVGSEVARNLIHHSDHFESQVGLPVALDGIAVQNPTKPRDSSIPSNLITTDPVSLITNPNISIIIELIGGERPALDLLRLALSRGKHVVTANKEVLATHGTELIQLAEENDVNILYEASVGAGIPIIGPLNKDFLANDISSIYAIINGTTNYILTKMAQDGTDFKTALSLAQQLGYAEANPAHDIEGTDAAFKLAILSSLAFHTQVVSKEIYREGISRLSEVDFQYARELGFAIKLLAIASREAGSLSLRVHPALLSKDHLLAKVDGVFNAIEIEGDLIGKVVLHGQGAGPKPTASAVLGDILEVARNLAWHGKPTKKIALNQNLSLSPIDELVTQYYVRVTVVDQAGVLAKIATLLGDLNISIATAIQKAADSQSQTAELVIMTHPAKESFVQQAIRQMDQLNVVHEVSNVIRVETGV